MKKKRFSLISDIYRYWGSKNGLKMKVTLILLLIFIGQTYAVDLYSQDKRLSLSMSNVPIKNVLEAIEDNSDFFFMYEAHNVNVEKRVSVSAENKTVPEILNDIFANSDIAYKINNRQIALTTESLSVAAQQKSISGKVTDPTGNPLPGVTVVLKGTTTGTVTDFDGKFSLPNVPSDATLVFAFVGMESQERVVGNNSIFNISLKETTIGIEEVVAVGYGTQKKATLTGAISSIRSEDIVATKNENIVNMLTGKLPGVRVWQKSSEPGNFDRTKFDIRGFGTPLIVIDGVPQGTDVFNRMDPNEVESISVLKDGSAAIYGVRAANGVILVTTKQGTGTKKFNISYQANQGWQNFLYMPDNVDAINYMMLTNESRKRSFSGNFIAQSTPRFLQPDFDLYTNGERRSVNWSEEVLKKSSTQQQHNITINGDANKIKYFFNLGYMDQGGILKSGDINYKRWNIRSNNNITITDNLRAQVNISAYMDNKNAPRTDLWTIFKAAWNVTPTSQVYANNNSDYFDYEDRHDNPVAWQESDVVGFRDNKKRDIQAQGVLEYDIPGVKGLTARGMYNFHFYNSTEDVYNHAYYLYTYDPQNDRYNGTALQSPTYASKSYWESTSTLFQLQLKYNKTFADAHHLGALALYEETDGKGSSFSAQRNILLEIPYMAAGVDTDQRGNAGFPSHDVRKAIVGKMNYDYKGKYLLDFSFRYDGSSKFSPKKQWGFFPTGSIGWRVSEESFVKNSDFLSFVNNLKVRASYGVMGDDGALNFQHISGYNYPNNGYIFNGNFFSGVQSRGMTNLDLTWSTSKTTDIGLDFDFWKGKLGGTFEYYKRNRDGLFATRSGALPGTVGVGLPQENLNSDQSYGYELNLTHRSKIKNVAYNIDANIAYARTKQRYVEHGPYGNSYDEWRNSSVDRVTGIWWGREYDGQFQDYQQIYDRQINAGGGNQDIVPGDYYYKDWNGDGFADGSDDHPIATYNMPLINFGATLGAEWKGLDLSLLFQGATMFFVRYEEQYREPLMFGRGAMTRFLDRWHTQNPTDDVFDPETVWIPGHYAAIGSPLEDGTRAVQNASYVRLKSIELGYSIPKRLLNPIGLEAVRVYVNGYNLLTMTGLENYDPEHPGSTVNGDDWNNSQGGYYYPNNKTYNVGIKVTF